MNANDRVIPLIEVAPEVTEVCLCAILKWGKSTQIVHSMGECGEFLEAFGRYLAAVGKHFQGRDPELDNVIEEAADVLITLLQLRELVSIEKFDPVLARKFEKFSAKVNENEIHSPPII